jgi:signal transduction histidine kinase
VLGHDLRSPVTSICASADLLLRDEAAQERRVVLKRISGSAHRMDRMVRALVDYARTYFGGAMPIYPAADRMDRICRRVVDEIESSHPAAAIAMHVTGNVEGSWDGDRVAQAVINLVVNAVDHSSGAVGIDVVGGAEAVTVTVTNDGAFPEALRETLFQPFRKGDEGGRGLGLGLFIVRQILVAHGGRVELVTSDPGKTRFSTWWPRSTPPSG